MHIFSTLFYSIVLPLRAAAPRPPGCSSARLNEYIDSLIIISIFGHDQWRSVRCPFAIMVFFYCSFMFCADKVYANKKKRRCADKWLPQIAIPYSPYFSITGDASDQYIQLNTVCFNGLTSWNPQKALLGIVINLSL